MAVDDKPGSRLLVALIDEHATTDPLRVWAAVPVDDGDLTKGFHDITYRAFANAINHAACWLQNHLPPAAGPFETVAYAGPKDIRYPIIAVAVAKVGRKLLLPSPYATAEAQAHLLHASGCQTFIHAAPFRSNVETVLSNMQGNKVHALQVPELSDWLREGPSPHLQYRKTWDEARTDPWMIFHTSGTTGLPKLVTYTHQMMASLDAAELMPDAHEETMNRHFEKKRWYTPLPSLHFVGMTVALQFTVYLGAILVVGPAGAGPTGPLVARDTLRYGKVQGAMLPPALIDGLCGDAIGLECLRNLECLYFAGAPLTRQTAEKLLGHVTLKPAMGSTEAGAYFLQIRGEDDWEYYSFRPAMGFEFQHTTGDLYEPVFVRQPRLERWQQVFHVYPELNKFHTKDLFSKHPSKPGLWKYVGRTDDMIPFSHGECLYVAEIEAEIAAHQGVSGVLVGGQGRAKPFLLVEWKDDDLDQKTRLEQLWPVVEHANRRCSDLVKLTRELILFANPSKKLVRTVKGSVSRRESEQLYAEEIERLYKQ
ncbi:putative AMP-binding enzyme [Zopfia rhizophila CBS 207.26]|uniref:Putative AMP-binding enzyme n=1 Tax=Zopfia rhizophila CBS 207.26 TaxID=1314779 RepID=A0A6A6DHV6_9PEZI|nr:putative AMP-binding enzyme [Zopfia rhizophila CBS 207.26]